MKVWNTDGKLLETFQVGAWVLACCFSSDNANIVCGCWSLRGTQIQSWNIATGKNLKTITCQVEHVSFC